MAVSLFSFLQITTNAVLQLQPVIHWHLVKIPLGLFSVSVKADTPGMVEPALVGDSLIRKRHQTLIKPKTLGYYLVHSQVDYSRCPEERSNKSILMMREQTLFPAGLAVYCKKYDFFLDLHEAHAAIKVRILQQRYNLKHTIHMQFCFCTKYVMFRHGKQLLFQQMSTNVIPVLFLVMLKASVSM